MMSPGVFMYIALVVLYLNFALLSSADNEEWKQYHDELFATQGPIIGSDKTIELLNKLHNLYQGKSDDATMKRAERINELLALTKVNEEQCNDKYMEHVKNLMRLMYLRRNVRPFVEHQRELQYDLCKSLAAQKLEESVHNLSNDDRVKVEALVDKIDHGTESRYYCEEKKNEVVAGVLSYMESQHGRILDKVAKPNGKPDRSLVFPLVKQSLQGLCERVVIAVEETLRMYDTYDLTLGEARTKDEFVSKWYHTKRVCVHLLFHLVNIEEAVYQGIKFTDTNGHHESLGSRIMQMIHS